MQIFVTNIQILIEIEKLVKNIKVNALDMHRYVYAKKIE